MYDFLSFLFDNQSEIGVVFEAKRQNMDLILCHVFKLLIRQIKQTVILES